MPEQALMYLKRNIKKQWVLCFVSVLCFGLTAHLYKLTSWIPNWDSLVFFHDEQDMLVFGRCFLKWACSPTSYYDLPWLNGLLSLIYIGAGAVCICEIFGFKKKFTIIMAGAILSTFPTVTSTLTYNYVADGYFLAFLCMCLASLLLIKGWKYTIPAALLIMFGYGIYQAYITVAIMLLLAYLLDQLVYQSIKVKEARKLIARFLTGGIAGSALYYIVLNCMMAVKHVQFSDYQGVSDAVSFSKLNLLKSVKKCVKGFLYYFFDFTQGVNWFAVLNTVMFLFLIGFVIAAIRKREIYKEGERLFWTLFCLAAMPFCAYILYFILPSVDYHNLMVMGHVVFYLAFLLHYERLDRLNKAALGVKQWGIFGLSILITANFIVLANVSYVKLQMAYWRSYGIIVQIADRIATTPGARDCEKMAVLGHLAGSEAYSVQMPPDMTGITDTYILRKRDAVVGQNVMLSMLKDYCGVEYQDASNEELEEIRQMEEFAEMGKWPEEGSVSVLNGMVVIRMEEEIEESIETEENIEIKESTTKN